MVVLDLPDTKKNLVNAGSSIFGFLSHQIYCSTGYGQGLVPLDVVLPRALRSICAACACDGLRSFNAPLPCPLTLMACACERLAGTSEGESMSLFRRLDAPSNCAFSPIARER